MENMPERNKDVRFCSPHTDRADFIPEDFAGAKNTSLSFISCSWILRELDLYNKLPFICKSLSGFMLPTNKRALRTVHLSMLESGLSILSDSTDGPEQPSV